MTELADGAGIYTLSYQPGAVVTGNIIHDIQYNEYSEAWEVDCLYFDSGSSGWYVADNVIYNIPQDVYHQHIKHGNNDGSTETWDTSYVDVDYPSYSVNIGTIVKFDVDNPSATVSALMSASGPAAVANSPSINLNCSESAGGIPVTGNCAPWAAINLCFSLRK